MNKNTDPDIVTISDDSDVEIIQKVDNSPCHDLQNWPVQSPHRNPKRKKSKVNKSENLPDLDNLSQEELDEYLSQVKGQIEEYNEECKATGQIGLQLQAIAADTGSLFEDTSTEKYDYDKSKIKNETPEEDDIEFLEVKGRSKDVKGVELKRKSVSDLVKRKVRKKSDGKLALAKPRLVPRITSKTPISPMGGEKAEKAIPSSFQRVKKVKPKIEDSYIEEELASMSHSGVDEYLQHLQKPKIKSTVDKPVIKKKPKPPVEKPSSDEKMETKLPEIENIPPSLTGSLRKIMQMTAHTPEEKFKVLDARDKLYKIMRDKDPSLKRGALAGTCPDMCPEKERLMREFQYQVSIFEMVNYPKNTALDHKLAVKQYSRSSADQEEPLPHELRPINVLTMTMNYLLHNIVDYCELADENLEDWYMFMWDRTRALRKELTQQGIHNVETVTLVEQCARFHIHCAERLVDQDSAVYDDKINTENLTKCLQTLKYMYKDLANLDIYCQNEPEFVCYSLLLNLNNTSVFTELSDMSERVMMSSPVRFALDIMAAWETRNYIRFFNLVKRTSYLNGCLLRRYFNEMRLYATKTMIRSYCTKNYSPQMAISRFTENLNFEGEEECQKFLEHCNFTVYRADDGLVTVNFDRLSFQNPETPFPASRAYIFIEDKKQAPLSVIMAGGFLPPKSYENHVPQSSFTASGELKLDSLLCMDLMEFANMPPPPPPPPLIRDMSKPPPLITKPTSALTIFSEMLTKAQKTSSRDPRLREPEPAPIFPAMEEKPPTNVFTSNIFGQKSEVEPQKSIFGQKPDSTSHSIFSKPETTTNSLFAKPEASSNPLFSKPETSSNLLFSKPETSATSIFGQKSQENSNFLFGQKTETTTPSIFGQKPPTVSNPIFAPKQDANPILAQNSNGTIFGQNTSSSIFNQKSVTSTSSNIFGNVAKNIFSSGDNHVTSTSASLFPKAEKGIFSSAVNKPSVFSNEPKNIFARLGPPQPATFSNFQFKPSVDPEEEKKKEELALQEKLEKEREEMERKRKEEEEEARRKREAEEIRKRKEAEEAQRLELMLLEQKRKLEEERERKERERREIERRQEEERLRKLEAERRERERIQREEQARLEKLRQAEMERLEKIRRIEEEKRQAEIAYQKKIEAKCKDLKEKYLQWKTKIWIEKWRMKAWNLIEERKMRMYQEERKLKYPPVCTEEVLNGNPYGLVIPSVLVLESYSTRRPKISKNENRRENIIIHELPVIKVHRIVGRLLEKRVKKSFGKNNSSFPWKLVLSVPDESEAGEFSKHIETFVEMHFVDNFNWQFGKQGGPLYCNEHCLNAFCYGVCIRKIRGCDLYEGEEYNPKAACGSNGLVFLMTDDKENVRIAAKRLRNVLLARPPLPKIPVVIFVLGNQIEEENLIKSLNLNRWRESHLSEYYIFKCAGKSQEELAIQLIQCVKCIAENSAPISPIQCSKLSNFLSSSNFFDSIWRRMDTSLSNYKIILKEPKFLIEYYNTCIDRLGEHFLDDAYEEYTLSGDEFKSTQSDRPERDEIYTRELLNALEALKLPQWPKEIPKSSHQLNYRIHQYCKKIGNQEKPKIRNIKWILYRIIRRSLLWKGLDIYCDEDINDILLHFPWTQVFQELSRSLLNQYIEKYQTGEDVAVIYDTEKLEQLSFECSLIGKFLQKSKRQSNLPNFEEDWNPHLENDSIIYAYTSAIERESSKRKRDSSIDENLDALFSSPAGKRQVLEQDEVPAILNDYSELKTDFQSLSDKLDELQKRINENKKILIETNNMLQ